MHEVKNDEIGLDRFSHILSAQTIGGLLYPVAFLFQRKGHELTDIVVILYYQYDRLSVIHNISPFLLRTV